MRIRSLHGFLLLALLSCRGSDMPPNDPADPTPARASGGRLGAGGASASGGATGGAGPSPTTDGSGGYGAEDDAGAHGGAPDGPTGSGDLVEAADAVDSAPSTGDAGLARDTPPGATGVDAGKPTDTSCPGYRKGSHAQAGVTVADFCAAYLKSCPSDGELRLRDLADCQTSYGQADGSGQTCLAGHLCEAIASTGNAGKNMNCEAAGHAQVCR
jgi:hypothetical protein